MRPGAPAHAPPVRADRHRRRHGPHRHQPGRRAARWPAFGRRLCGREDARAVRIVAYAVIEAPFAAIRRHVAAKESPPPYVDLLIRATYEAVLELLLGGDRS